MYQYFIWNGINSLDMGVVMLKAPSIFMPERRVNEIEIAGSNGILHEDTGTFANYTKDSSYGGYRISWMIKDYLEFDESLEIISSGGTSTRNFICGYSLDE